MTHKYILNYDFFSLLSHLVYNREATRPSSQGIRFSIQDFILILTTSWICSKFKSFVMLVSNKRTGCLLAIGLFQKYHNTLCCPSKILHKNCFQFLFGLTIIVPGEVENSAHAKFWRDNKEHYGLFEKGIIIFM